MENFKKNLKQSFNKDCKNLKKGEIINILVSLKKEEREEKLKRGCQYFAPSFFEDFIKFSKNELIE